MYALAAAPEAARHDHILPLSMAQWIDPIDNPPSPYALCGVRVTAWTDRVESSETILAADGPACPQCAGALRTLASVQAVSDAEREYVAARAMISMALVRRADEASSEARAARDEVVRRCIAAGLSMYAVAQLTGLSQTAIGKIANSAETG